MFGLPSASEIEAANNKFRSLLHKWQEERWVVTCTNTRTGEWHRHSWTLVKAREEALQPEQEVTLHYRENS